MITEVNVSKNEMPDTQRCRKQVFGYQKYLILKRFIHVSTVLRLKNVLFIFSTHFMDPEGPCGLPLHSQLWKFIAFQTIWPLKSKYINQSIEVLADVDLFIIVQHFKNNQRYEILHGK